MKMRKYTAEHVSQGHPDKFADQFADAVLDEVIRLAHEHGDPNGGDETRKNLVSFQRTALEVLAKDHLVAISGEARFGPDIRQRLDIRAIGRKVWSDVGYPDADMVTVLDHIQMQSPELQVSSDRDGAGDQGIMVGYANSATKSMMPPEWELARDLCQAIMDLRGQHDWIRADAKTQVTLDDGGRPSRIVIAVQHDESVVRQGGDGKVDNAATCAEIKSRLMPLVVAPMFGADFDPERVSVNGTGSFVIGGTIGDAGVVGRKIVVDAYGPRVPVGGGAYSGKDPTKVDRSAAYMARRIAKTAAHMGIRGAKEVTVQIAYCIGKLEPEMVTAVTETGVDISDWVMSRFPDLSPRNIIETLDLWRMKDRSWSYQETASFGHYGNDRYPWEQIADVND
jgi:S-adenosylmethionine synthetase